MTMVLPLGWQVLDANGNPYSGAKAYTYTTGTSTPQTTYSNAALSTPHANPVVADAAGRFPAVYGPTSADYKVVLKTSADVEIATYDPVQMTGAVANLSVDTAQIANDAVTNAKLANMAVNTVKGRKTSGTGDPEDLTVAELGQYLGLWVPLTTGGSEAVSAAASYIKDGIPSWVNFLRVAMDLFPVSDGVALNILLRKASGTDITGSYAYQSLVGADTSASAATATGQTAISTFGSVQNDANTGGVKAILEVAHIQSSRYKRVTLRTIGNDGTLLYVLNHSYQVNDTAAITGIKISFGSGNISEGRVRVEGCV